MLSFKDKKQLSVMLLMLLTVVFIFVQSMLSPKVSGEESETVGDVVVDVYEGVVGTDTPEKVEQVNKFKTFIDNNIRKIAHFLEFGILGAEMAVLLMLAYGKDKVRPSLPAPVRKVALSLPFPVSVAFLDESIQLLSSRGPSVLDMWIDIIGYLCFFIIAYLIFIFVGKKKTYKKLP